MRRLFHFKKCTVPYQGPIFRYITSQNSLEFNKITETDFKFKIALFCPKYSILLTNLHYILWYESQDKYSGTHLRASLECRSVSNHVIKIHLSGKFF